VKPNWYGVVQRQYISLGRHHPARSTNRLTYGLCSAGISDAQKQKIVEGTKPWGIICNTLNILLFLLHEQLKRDESFVIMMALELPANS
jgi:hypothetical protein